MKTYKTIALGCLVGVMLLTTAFFIQSFNFNGTQFSVNAPFLSIANGVLTTNQTVWTSFTVNSTNANSYFAGTVFATNGFTAIGGVFTGNGSGLTNLSGSGGVVAPGIGIGVTTNGSVYTVYKDTTDDRSVFIDEEFLSGNSGNGSIGTYGWSANSISSGLFSGNNATVAAHPGIFRLDSTAVGGSGESFVLADSGTPGHYPIFGMQTVPWRMRLIFETGSSTNLQRFFAGVASGSFNATNQPTTGVYVQFDAKISNQLQLLCGDGTLASVNMTNVNTSTWYDVLVGSDTAGTVWATVNGATGFTNTTHCPNAALTPFFMNAVEDGAAASVSLFVDAFKLWQNYPQRY